MISKLALGPIMADVNGFQLQIDEKERLLDPLIGGVILFRRNFQNIEQLKDLVKEIKSLRNPELIIAVDHEGGRVQRFIEGFTRLPAMNVLGEIWDRDGEIKAINLAEKTGWVLATELRVCGIDFSFTPVLDLDWNKCQVIGNRSFHSNPNIIASLACAISRGLKKGGMPSCGKHFPGHGYVEGDSHHVLPEDVRNLEQLEKNDLVPFKKMIANGMEAIMPAHVLYPKVDGQPAGFSSIWLLKVLRKELGFNGVVFSDDLTMEGASIAGSIVERTHQSFLAGCDIALICNRPDLVDELREHYVYAKKSSLEKRWQSMKNKLPIKEAIRMSLSDKFKNAKNQVRLLSSPKDTEGGVKVGESF